ncbi:hypothetical protein chiPu_0032909, partial [Chiloscyllium punctatum]|nr:hypothetical protein [Chiloscyllium punctatum]
MMAAKRPLINKHEARNGGKLKPSNGFRTLRARGSRGAAGK